MHFFHLPKKVVVRLVVHACALSNNWIWGDYIATDCSKHPEKPSLSVVGCSGGDGFCDLAGGL